MKYRSLMLVLLSFIALMSLLGVNAQEVDTDTFIIYLEGGEGTFENYNPRAGFLWSVPISGGEPVMLSPNDRVIAYYVTEQGQIVYRDVWGDIYSVPVSGGTPVFLNEGLEFESSFLISPDEKYLVFASRQVKHAGQIYSVEIDSGMVTLLSDDNLSLELDFLSEVGTQISIAPDSQSVLYTAGTARGVFQLYQVPISGGESVPLTGRLASGGNVEEFAIASDMSGLLYLADQVADEDFDLFYVDLGTGEVTTIFTDFPEFSFLDGPSEVVNFTFASENQYAIVWTGEEIYSYQFASGTLNHLSQGLDSSQVLSKVLILQDDKVAFLKGGTLVVSSMDGTSRSEVPFISGWPFQTILGNLDEDRILFLRQYREPGAFGTPDYFLYSYSLSEGVETLLAEDVIYHDEFSVFINATYYAVAPDKSSIAFFGYDENELPQLYIVKADGTEKRPLSPFTGSEGFASQWVWFTEDGQSVVYVNDEQAAGFADMYIVPIDGSSEPQRLNTNDTAGVIAFTFYPSANRSLIRPIER